MYYIKVIKTSYKAKYFLVISIIFTLNLFSNTSYAAQAYSGNKAGDSIIKKCGQDVNCYSLELNSSAKTNGISKTLDIFKYVSDKTNGIYGGCNNVGRAIGNQSYLLFKLDALKYHANICGPSYAFGVMFYIGKYQPKLAGSELLKTYCFKDFNPTACAYGVGNSMSTGKFSGSEVQIRCDKYFNSIVNEQDKLYEHSASGICMLGWVSGKVSTLPAESFSSIEKASAICAGMKAPGLEPCLGEATFAYTYVGSSSTASRLLKVRELRKRCNTDKNEVCMQFVGKALNDFFLYSYRVDYNKKTDLQLAGKLVTELCNSKWSNACLYGFLSAQMTHTSIDSAKQVCTVLKGDYLKKCNIIISQVGKVL